MKPTSILLYLLFSNTLFAQELIHQNNIVYGKSINWQNQPEDLTLDLIYPSKTTRFPLIVFLHGGGFLHGAKKELTKLCEQVAREEFAVANVEYRLGYDQSSQNFRMAIAQAI